MTATMLIKCESKSSRVKGVSFHPRLAWLLVSLHNGTIQLWDFRIGCLLDKFEEHEGPVRGIDFHLSQPIFVSGGDDYKVKLWNYKQKKSLFTLYGHLDYIRTVQFHSTNPWIVSASDDQTVRIWNWQNRHCLSVLAGHSHYVMCAKFHPTDDLMASASLDQTVRLWNLAGIKEKSGHHYKPGGGYSSQIGGGNFGSSSSEVFSTSDAVCKFVLEGHERGVNFVSFHPTLPMLASGADDRLIKLWRYDDVKWWEVDTLRGHFHNISSVIFHPTKDLIISNSEDRSIRVWDLSRRTLIHTYRRDSDRFWIMTGLPNSNLLAVGHDTGMVVFKLEKERPAASVLHLTDKKSLLFYVKDNWIYCQNDPTVCIPSSEINTPFALQSSISIDNHFMNNRSLMSSPSASNNSTNPKGVTAICACRKLPNAMISGPLSMLVNPLNTSEINMIVFHNDPEGNNMDLITVATDAKSFSSQSDQFQCQQSIVSCRTKSFVSAAFCARNRYAAVDSSGGVNIHYLNGDVCKRLEWQDKVDAVFYAGNNRILLKTTESMVLYDISTKKVIGELGWADLGISSVQGKVKYAIWSPRGKYVAFLSKHSVLLANNRLEYVACAHESIRVKSGAWDEFDGFMFNSGSHIKYLLPSGETGLLQSICSTSAIYIHEVKNGRVICIDKDSKVRNITLKMTEYLFKISLRLKRYDQAAAIIQNGRLVGNAVVNFLTQQGHPEVAAHVVDDLETRLLLGLSSGDIMESHELLMKLDAQGGSNSLTDAWKALADSALDLGQFSMAEKAVQKSRDLMSLVFLYAVTGQFAKVGKVGDIAGARSDTATQFHTALLKGDVQTRINVLVSSGMLYLAYSLAKIHNLKSERMRIKSLIEQKTGQEFDDSKLKLPESPSLFFPPIPIFKPSTPEEMNWPMNHSKSSSTQTMDKNQFQELLSACRGKPFSEHSVRSILLGSRDAAGLSTAEPSPAIPIDQSVDELFGNEALKSRGVDEGALWNDDGDDIFADLLQEAATANAVMPSFSKQGNSLLLSEGVDPLIGPLLTPGESPLAKVIAANNEICAFKIAAGDFEGAFALLRKRIALIDASPLVPIFEQAFQASQSFILGISGTIGWNIPILESNSSDSTPLRYVTLQSIFHQINKACELFGTRKLDDSLSKFKSILASFTLLTTSIPSDEIRINESIRLCAEYIMAIELEKKKITSQNSAEKLDISWCQTLCAIKPNHRYFLMRDAVKAAVKANNNITAAKLLKRLLDLCAKVSEATSEVDKWKQLLIVCDKKGTDEIQLSVNLSQTKDVVLASDTLIPLKGSESGHRCPLCNSVSSIPMKCPICKICKTGENVLGLNFMLSV